MSDAGLTGTVADAAAGNSDATQGQPVEQNSEGSTGVNPAWSELLGVLPTSLHSMVTPHLTKWDQQAQQRVTESNAKYEPWNPLVEQGYEPDMVQGMLQLIENNPQQLIQSLVEFHKLNPQELFGLQDQAQGDGILDLDQIQPNGEEFDITQHPKFQEMAQQVEQMQQWAANQSQQEIDKRANAEIDQELKVLHDKHGQFDERALFAFAQTIPDLKSLDQAFDAMNSYNQSILQNRPTNSAPPVLAPGGGTPAAPSANPAEMSPGQRKGLVASILAQNASSQ